MAFKVPEFNFEFTEIEKSFFVDRCYYFVGYIFRKHLFPFSISALLLLILSIDDEIKTLVNILQMLNALLIPSFILTVIAGYIYYISIKIQIQNYYLLPNWDYILIPFFSFIFFFVCFIITIIVLYSNKISLSLGSLWASILISLLSLTGVRWGGLSSWVESVGIVSPDYLEGRKAAEKLGTILETVRNKSVAEYEDLEEFLNSAKKLCENIDGNLELETKNTKKLMTEIEKELTVLIKCAKEFKDDESYGLSNFKSCVYGKCFQYREFMSALTNLSNYWPKWNYQ